MSKGGVPEWLLAGEGDPLPLVGLSLRLSLAGDAVGMSQGLLLLR